MRKLVIDTLAQGNKSNLIDPNATPIQQFINAQPKRQAAVRKEVVRQVPVQTVAPKKQPAKTVSQPQPKPPESGDYIETPDGKFLPYDGTPEGYKKAVRLHKARSNFEPGTNGLIKSKQTGAMYPKPKSDEEWDQLGRVDSETSTVQARRTELDQVPAKDKQRADFESDQRRKINSLRITLGLPETGEPLERGQIDRARYQNQMADQNTVNAQNEKIVGESVLGKLVSPLNMIGTPANPLYTTSKLLEALGISGAGDANQFMEQAGNPASAASSSYNDIIAGNALTDVRTGLIGPGATPMERVGAAGNTYLKVGAPGAGKVVSAGGKALGPVTNKVLGPVINKLFKRGGGGIPSVEAPGGLSAGEMLPLDQQDALARFLRGGTSEQTIPSGYGTQGATPAPPTPDDVTNLIIKGLLEKKAKAAKAGDVVGEIKADEAIKAIKNKERLKAREAAKAEGKTEGATGPAPQSIPEPAKAAVPEPATKGPRKQTTWRTKANGEPVVSTTRKKDGNTLTDATRANLYSTPNETFVDDLAAARAELARTKAGSKANLKAKEKVAVLETRVKPTATPESDAAAMKQWEDTLTQAQKTPADAPVATAQTTSGKKGTKTPEPASTPLPEALQPKVKETVTGKGGDAPIRVYHGTPYVTDTPLNPRKSFGRLGAQFVTTSREQAGRYASSWGTSPGVREFDMPSNLNLFDATNPEHIAKAKAYALKVTEGGRTYDTVRGFETTDALIDRLTRNGKDFNLLEHPVLFNWLKRSGFDGVRLTGDEGVPDQEFFALFNPKKTLTDVNAKPPTTPIAEAKSGTPLPESLQPKVEGTELKPGWKGEVPGNSPDKPPMPVTVRKTVGTGKNEGKVQIEYVNGFKEWVDPSVITVKSKKIGGRNVNMTMDNDQFVAGLDRLYDKGTTGYNELKAALGKLQTDPEAIAAFDAWAKKKGVSATAVQGAKTGARATTSEDQNAGLEKYKARLKREIEKLENGEYKPKGEKLDLDEEAEMLKAKRDELKRLMKGEQSIAPQDTFTEKAESVITGLNTGTDVPMRLADFGAGGVRGVVTVGESYLRGPLSRLQKNPLLRQEAWNPSKISRALSGTKGAFREEVANVLAGKDTIELDKVGGLRTDSKLGKIANLGALSDAPMRHVHFHMALDDFAGNIAQRNLKLTSSTRKGVPFELERNRILQQLRKGEKPAGLTTDEFEDVMKAALDASLDGTYNNSNLVSRLNHYAERVLVNGGTDIGSKRLGKVGATGVRLFMRYAKILTNVGLDYINRTPYGMIEGGVRMGLKPKSLSQGRRAVDIASKSIVGTGLGIGAYMKGDPSWVGLRIEKNNNGEPYITMPPLIEQLTSPFGGIMTGLKARLIEDALAADAITEKEAGMLRIKELYVMPANVAASNWKNFWALSEGDDPGKRVGTLGSRVVPGAIKRGTTVYDSYQHRDNKNWEDFDDTWFGQGRRVKPAFEEDKDTMLAKAGSGLTKNLPVGLPWVGPGKPSMPDAPIKKVYTPPKRGIRN